MNPEYQINREQFEAWLFSQPDERIFNYVEGFDNDETGCVMCNFLREMTSIHPFCVGYSNVLYGTNHDLEFNLADWFVNMMLHRQDSMVTAVEAKTLYLKEFPNAIVGNNDTATNVASLSFNSIASVTESNATNKLNSPSKQIK